MIRNTIIDFVFTNWKSILLVVFFIMIAAKNRHDYLSIQKAYQTQVDSHKAQIDGLKEIHKQEIRKKLMILE